MADASITGAESMLRPYRFADASIIPVLPEFVEAAPPVLQPPALVDTAVFLI
jgi:hypothetical protein